MRCRICANSRPVRRVVSASSNARAKYQDVLAEIMKEHPKLEELDLFPAVPAPVAVLCGRETLPKVHPALQVHDFGKGRNGFVYQLTVNDV